MLQPINPLPFFFSQSTSPSVISYNHIFLVSTLKSSNNKIYVNSVHNNFLLNYTIYLSFQQIIYSLSKFLSEPLVRLNQFFPTDFPGIAVNPIFLTVSSLEIFPINTVIFIHMSVHDLICSHSRITQIAVLLN